MSRSPHFSKSSSSSPTKIPVPKSHMLNKTSSSPPPLVPLGPSPQEDGDANASVALADPRKSKYRRQMLDLINRLHETG